MRKRLTDDGLRGLNRESMIDLILDLQTSYEDFVIHGENDKAQHILDEIEMMLDDISDSARAYVLGHCGWATLVHKMPWRKGECSQEEIDKLFAQISDEEIVTKVVNENDINI